MFKILFYFVVNIKTLTRQFTFFTKSLKSGVCFTHRAHQFRLHTVQVLSGHTHTSGLALADNIGLPSYSLLNNYLHYSQKIEFNNYTPCLYY